MKDWLENLMGQKNCSKNTVKVWNEVLEQVDCVCQGPVFVWSQRGEECITQSQTDIQQKNDAMAQVNCPSRFPGSENSWNSATKQIDCICLGPVFVLNKAKSACITQSELNLENANCQNGKEAVLDYGVVKCQCPQRTWWVESLGKCATQYEWSQDCNNRFPGTIPANDKLGCQCPSGTKWNENIKRCTNKAVKPIKKTQCGRKVSKEELAPMLAKYKNMVKTQWQPKGLVTWTTLFNINIGLGRYISEDQYLGNVEIWKKKVRCYNSCVQSVPGKKERTAKDVKRFSECRSRCGKIRYISCP